MHMVEYGSFRSVSRLAPALVLIVTMASASPAFAQVAAADDPFNAASFDTTVSASVAPGGQATTTVLAGGTILVSAMASVPSTWDGYSASSSLSGRLFVKLMMPDYGSFYAAYNAVQTVFAGIAGSISDAGPAPDLYAPTLALSELHWSFDIGKLVFVRLGNQLISWGPSRVWTPVDFINLQKIDAFQSVDLRVGKPGLRVHVPLPSANAFLFTDFSGLVKAGAVQNPAESVAWAARFDATVGDVELGLTGFAGASVQDKLGLDFSGHVLGLSLYGESAYTPAYDSGSENLAIALGASRVVGDLKRWTVSSELFYNSSGSDLTGQYAAMAGMETLNPLYMGQFYGYASVRATELLASSLTSSLSALANLSDQSFIVRFTESFTIQNAVPFDVTVSWSGGGADKEFTWATSDNAIAVSFSVRADF
ncbi:MAG TPA: hypothetical protein VMX33_10950 [bacterium]|nr:hypothetical protein [bacterium]